MNFSKNFLILALVLLFAGVGAFLYFNAKPTVAALPFFGPRDVVEGDTVYHRISDFSFVDQTGKPVTLNDFKGSIIVADFFFTSCEGICPKMTVQMERMFAKYKGNPSVKFLSHTVDPERDTVEALLVYAEIHKADPAQWHFVTGDKKELYQQARESYMVVNDKGDGGPDDFVHTQNFALVDREHHVRGFYDGTDSLDINRMIRDIDLLNTWYKNEGK